MVTKKANAYDEDSIQHHKGLSAVRVRPGMYLGERGAPMVYRALKEIVDNSYDEYAAGRNLAIEVYADTKKDVYIVADKAQGIPVGLHKTAKISTLTLILTELHAGGKFDDKAYKTAAGTHGVGAAATNAVSSSFECWTYREKSWHYQAFKEGKPLAPVKKVSGVDKSVASLLQSAPKSGTVIKFTPDQSIVSIDKGKTPAKLDVPATANWLRNLAMMNKDLSITFTSGGKSRTFLNKIGIIKMLKDRVAKDELEPMGKPLILEDEVLSFAVQWTSYPEEDGVTSYVSSSTTRDGGTHLDEFYAALTKVVGEFKLQRDKYAPRDLRNGLVGVLNFKMSQPEFSSQVKDRLTSNLEKSVYDRTYAFCKAFFTANKALVRRIIKRASEVKKTKEQFKKLMDGVAKINSSKRGIMLPNILASARKCTSANREIFLVEGDSAAGTAKKARDSGYQEVLRLQGKPPNAIRTHMTKLVANKVIQNVLAAIGYDHREKDPYAKLRVNTILLLADADPDGKHINVLVLTLLYKLLPKLFEQGRVLICNAPLYSAYYKGNRYFGSTFQECYSQMPKTAPKDLVSRAKGWGELEPEVLEIIAFHPDTRNTIQIKKFTKDDHNFFNLIMGSETAARKQLLGL